MTDHSQETVLIAGAGGFIGGHLTGALLDAGYGQVKAVDCKPLEEWHQRFEGATESVLDLQLREAAFEAADGADVIVNLAADMGGMGFIESNRSLCMLSVLINTHLLLAAKDVGARRFFYSSSACVYPAGRQDHPDVTALKENDVYPAMPEDGYGWEKLYGELMCRHFRLDFGLETRVARYHNVYGPHGTWSGGREKAPAALCRKVAKAVLLDEDSIELWGDGAQTRSFTYIDDCLKGTMLLIDSDVSEPVNVGSSELVSIDHLLEVVETVAGRRFKRSYNLDAPKGVRGRNSDNTLISSHFGWEPSVSLADGIEGTYRWIYDQVAAELNS